MRAILLVLSRNNRQVQVLTNSALCIERDFFEFYRSIRAAVYLLLLYTYSAIAWFYEMGFCFYCTVTREAACDLACHTAKTQYRKFETNISRKGIAWPESQFPHSCVCGRFILVYSYRSVCLICGRKICGPILGIYKSLTDTWMWKLGLRPRNSFTGHT